MLSLGFVVLSAGTGERPCARGPPYPNCTVEYLRQHEYTIRVTAVDPLPIFGAALISHRNGSSDFNFAFTTAWFPPPPGAEHPDGLVVRVVECNDNHHPCHNVSHPEWTNAGALTVVAADITKGTLANVVNESSVFWAGSAPPPRQIKAAWGAADPRMRYRPFDKT